MSGGPEASLVLETAAPLLGPSSRRGGRGWPYWILDLIDLVPAPRWAVHLGVILVFTLVGHLVRWLDGSLAVGELSILRFFESSLAPLFLFAMRELDDVALRALARLRPVIDADDAAVERLAWDLTRIPPLAAGLALALGIVVGLTSLASQPAAYGLGPSNSIWTWGFEGLMAAASAAGGLVFVAHAIQQLRIVVRVHRRLVRVELFHLEPLYAFSSLTSRTGITLIALVAYGFGSISFLVGPVAYTLSPVDLAMLVALVALAIACFVLPLLGLHGRIAAAKEQRLAEANASLEKILGEVHARIGTGNLEAAAAMKDAVEAATSALAAVEKVSSWPWRPETVRTFVTALILPVALWFITVGLGRLLGA
jgi:hypothetical protein